MCHRPPHEVPKQWAGNGDGKAGLHGDGHLADSRPPVRVSMLESERWAGSLLLGRPGTLSGTSLWCGPQLNVLQSPSQSLGTPSPSNPHLQLHPSIALA